MSIHVSILNTKKSIEINDNTSQTDLISIIEEFQTHIEKNCELKVFIIDENTANFHQYVFEYLPTSKLSSKKWLLNNIIYSIQCDKTQKNMSKMFKDLQFMLLLEYRKC